MTAPDFSQQFIINNLNKKHFLRAPEYEVVARPALWKEYLENSLIFIRGQFPLFKLAKPYNWSVNPHGDMAWELYLHSFTFIGTLNYGFTLNNNYDEYINTDNDSIKELVFSYFDFLDLESTTSQSIVWDDHSASYRASYLCLAYANILYPYLNDSEKLRFRVVMRKHADMIIGFIESKFWILSNHTIFQLEGLIDIALTFFKDTQEGDRYLEVCTNTFLEYVKASISIDQGTTREHAIFYHVFLMERIRSHCDFLTANGIKTQLGIEDILLRMNRFLWLVMPTEGLIPSIGDTKFQMLVNSKYYQAFKSKLYIDKETSFLLKQHTDPGNLEYLNTFTDDGYYVFRDLENLDSGLLSIFMEKEIIGPHGHCDGGSFISYLGKTPLFIDSGGPYKYKNPLRYNYFQTQIAHNTLIYEKPTKYKNKIIYSKSGSNYGVLVSRAKMAEGVWWYRIFVQITSDILICIDLPLTLDEKSAIHTRYHLSPDAKIAVQSSDRFQIFIEDKIILIQYHDAPSDKKSNSFDPVKFSNEEQSRSFVTRKDGQYELGNLICRPLAPMQASVMVCNFNSVESVIVHHYENLVQLKIQEVSSKFKGGKIDVRWFYDGDFPVCTCEFQLDQ